jgi:hypothetical protein
MPAKREAARSSKATGAPTGRPKRSPVAREIISGLKEAAAFARGEISLPVRMVDVSEPVEVRAPFLRLAGAVSRPGNVSSRKGFSRK